MLPQMNQRQGMIHETWKMVKICSKQSVADGLGKAEVVGGDSETRQKFNCSLHGFSPRVQVLS